MAPTHYIKTGILSLATFATLSIAAAGTSPAYASPQAGLMTSFIQTIAASIEGSDAVDPERGIQSVIASGTFTGKSDHETRGTVRIVQTEEGYELRLGDDFYLDGAPTPVLGFGVNGEYVHATQFADLDRKRGSQSYKLPADFNPANVTEVFVWCERFDIPLGVARLG